MYANVSASSIWGNLDDIHIERVDNTLSSYIQLSFNAVHSNGMSTNLTVKLSDAEFALLIDKIKQPIVCKPSFPEDYEIQIMESMKGIANMLAKIPQKEENC